MSRKIIVITEVTKMQNRRVCIAGYDRELNCVRPVLPSPGVLIDHLYENDELIVFPKERIRFNFTTHHERPPHIEDYNFESQSIESLGQYSDERWHDLLSNTDSRTFSNLYPGMVDRYVLPGSDGPSLGTIKAMSFSFYFSDIQAQKLRATVQDQDSETIYDIPINDIVFTQFVLYRMRRYGNNYRKNIKELMNGKEIFIRFGLARPWMPSHVQERRCYLQVTGVYTIPDIYGGSYKRLLLRWINSLK